MECDNDQHEHQAEKIKQRERAEHRRLVSFENVARGLVGKWAEVGVPPESRRDSGKNRPEARADLRSPIEVETYCDNGVDCESDDGKSEEFRTGLPTYVAPRDVVGGMVRVENTLENYQSRQFFIAHFVFPLALTRAPALPLDNLVTFAQLRNSET